jgi:hypothetical protein
MKGADCKQRRRARRAAPLPRLIPDHRKRRVSIPKKSFGVGEGVDLEFEGLVVLALDLEFGLEFFH